MFVVSEDGVVFHETTGVMPVRSTGVGKDKIPESLQISTPIPESNTKTETEERMTKVPAEEHVDNEEHFKVVGSDLVAENVENEYDPSEIEKEPSVSEIEKEPTEAEKEISESEKECSDVAEKEPSKTMEVETDPETAPLGEPDDDSAAEESPLINIKGLKIEELLHRDQFDKINSLADTQIVCEDGHVPIHRYILMAASSWINEILINEDPSELAVIHIPDVKVANVVQVMCILYSGKALYKKSDEGHIYKIFQMLGVGTEGLQFRNSKPEDGSILGKLRFYEKELQSEEEGFIPNTLQNDSPEIPMVEANVDNDVGEELIRENIVQYDEVEETAGPRVVSKEPKKRGRKLGQKNRGRKRGAKRKAAIQIVDVRMEDEGDQNPEENDEQPEVEFPAEHEDVENEEVDEDVIFEEEVIHPPNSKKPRCEPSTSSAAGSSQAMMHSGKAVVIQDLEELEEIEFVIKNDPSGCCTDISSVPVEDLRLLLTTCPVCKKHYMRMKTASKCLRAHGLRRCWICLKLVPSNGQDFYQHNLKHIIPGTVGRVSCSFCHKQFDYNIGINTHMGNYHFSRLLETTTKDLDKTKTLTVKQIKTLKTLNRGLANEKVPKNIYTIPNATNEQNMKIEEIVGNEDSEEVETSSSDGDDPDFVPADSDLKFTSNYDEDRNDEQQQPKTRHSQSADQRRTNIPSTASTSASAQNSPLVKPPPPELGRVLLEMKEIDGQIYNIYGLINPTSTDSKNKFSKVIAIRNTDVQARANLEEQMKKQIKQNQ